MLSLFNYIDNIEVLLDFLNIKYFINYKDEILKNLPNKDYKNEMENKKW